MYYFSQGTRLIRLLYMTVVILFISLVLYRLVLRDAGQSPIQHPHISYYRLSSTYAADFDGDGEEEMAICETTTPTSSASDFSIDYSTARVEKNGKIIWRNPEDLFSSVVVMLHPMDLTGEGRDELIFCSRPEGSGGFQDVYIFRWDGNAFSSIADTPDGHFTGIYGGGGSDLFFDPGTGGPMRLIYMAYVDDGTSKFEKHYFVIQYYEWKRDQFKRTNMIRTKGKYHTAIAATEELDSVIFSFTSLDRVWW